MATVVSSIHIVLPKDKVEVKVDEGRILRMRYIPKVYGEGTGEADFVITFANKEQLNDFVDGILAVLPSY